jgi:hypothetical protein
MGGAGKGRKRRRAEEGTLQTIAPNSETPGFASALSYELNMQPITRAIMIDLHTLECQYRPYDK